MKKAEIEVYEKLHIQIKEMHMELGVLSKKSPDSAINKFKLKFVNQLLNEANTLLGKKYQPFDDFELFDVDDMPSNSDVVMIISQYIKCLERFKKDNTYLKSCYSYWKIEDMTGEVRTTRPRLD